MTFRIAVLAVLLTASVAIPARGQDQSATPGTPTEAAPGKPMRVRISGNIMESQLVQRVAPVYPPLARAAQVVGTVVLHAVIAPDGSVQQLDLVSGPPLLLQAALDAVKQWRYRPTYLNDKPIEVETTIQVVFTLDETPSQDSRQSDPQLMADIRHLFDAMRLQAKEEDAAHVMFKVLRPTILASLPPTPNREKIADAYGEKFAALLSSQEFLDRMAALYAKYLSDDDIKALAAFYETPAGQHYNEFSGKVEAEAGEIGQQLTRENLPNIYKSLCQDFPELNGVAKFCPSDQPQNHGLLVAPDALRADTPESGD
jgi:TonB family protein